jgi:multimeric flavodoxin WrbA
MLTASHGAATEGRMNEAGNDGEPHVPEVRKGQGPPELDRAEFARRLRRRFFDPAFDDADAAIETIIDRAWDGYIDGRKAPRTRRAGTGFADPEYELSIDWLETRAAIHAAQLRHDDREARRRILLVVGSPRNDRTCPGEASKTWRLARIAEETIANSDCDCDLLDLSHLTSEYGRVIYPCKACVSTAMPLCHWPCSCYPNHSLGQVGDWMAEIYPRWVAAHGILIVTPVHWLQAPSALKLMIDRLVCADGGNPDPTSTGGKDPERAKRLELEGWDYPRHLAGRAFAVVVHGDTEGTRALRDALVAWLTGMRLVLAGADAALERYVGYYEPYASSHEALDREEALHEEVRNAARSLVRAVGMLRAGRVEPDAGLESPRPK